MKNTITDLKLSQLSLEDIQNNTVESSMSMCSSCSCPCGSIGEDWDTLDGNLD